jgi:hypothetical protein
MTEFQNKHCVVVRGFLDELTVKTLSLYMEHKYRANQWSKRSADFTSYEDDPSAFKSYADPLAEVVLKDSIPYIENVVGHKVFPTYSYSRIYLKGDELTPHVDRPSCEISVTVNIANVGGLWPIWMRVPEKDPIKVELNPGDAVIYRGCEVEHWREKMVDQDITVQFMLHYVNQNGPNAEYKWDKRPGLGYLITARSM